MKRGYFRTINFQKYYWPAKRISGLYTSWQHLVGSQVIPKICKELNISVICITQKTSIQEHILTACQSNTVSTQCTRKQTCTTYNKNTTHTLIIVESSRTVISTVTLGIFYTYCWKCGNLWQKPCRILFAKDMESSHRYFINNATANSPSR